MRTLTSAFTKPRERWGSEPEDVRSLVRLSAFKA